MAWAGMAKPILSPSRRQNVSLILKKESTELIRIKWPQKGGNNKKFLINSFLLNRQTRFITSLAPFQAPQHRYHNTA